MQEHSNLVMIGVSGKNLHGKDSFAARLVEHHGFTRVAFTDPMREITLALDPIISDGWRLAALVETFGWEEAKADPEVHRTLQLLGTEAGRGDLGDSIWVDTAMCHARQPGLQLASDKCDLAARRRFHRPGRPASPRSAAIDAWYALTRSAEPNLDDWPRRPAFGSGRTPSVPPKPGRCCRIPENTSSLDPRQQRQLSDEEARLG